MTARLRRPQSCLAWGFLMMCTAGMVLLSGQEVRTSSEPSTSVQPPLTRQQLPADVAMELSRLDLAV